MQLHVCASCMVQLNLNSFWVVGGFLKRVIRLHIKLYSAIYMACCLIYVLYFVIFSATIKSHKAAIISYYCHLRLSFLRNQIGIRYTGGGRMLLMLSFKFGIVPIVLPVGIWDFEIDRELWDKLKSIPFEPWVGAVQWAFVSLPKIKFVLSPFRLFNLMGMS